MNKIHFRFEREDGVVFVGDSHSPNGTIYVPLNPSKKVGVMVTAGDAVWASVPVGKFETVADALSAIETFQMPDSNANA